jgi:hypothetical protein
MKVKTHLKAGQFNFEGISQTNSNSVPTTQSNVFAVSVMLPPPPA